MPGPGDGPFGCRASAEVARACQSAADSGTANCALEPPADYWSFGGNRGTLCDEICMQRDMEELRRRAVPECMCTCSPGGRQGDAEAQPPPKKVP
jgi:hypothetical protein